MLNQEQVDYLTLLVDNELAVSRLYKAYAERSESNSDFWMALSKEEITHSEWIITLSAEVDRKDAVFKIGSISKEEIQASIDETQEEIDRVSNIRMNYSTHKEQLKVALNKEKSLLENKFFSFFKTSSPELRVLLKKLETENKLHRKRIEEELKIEENK